MKAGNAMSEETYNGWTNYPTWCVNLWLSNDEGLYNLTRERALEAIADAEADDSADPIGEMTQWLEELCSPGNEYGLIPELEGFPADLLGWVLGSVNWHEIATNWVADES